MGCGSLAAQQEGQCNRIQGKDGKKTNACQCEHLRHGFPSLHASHGGAVTRPTFFIGRGISPKRLPHDANQGSRAPDRASTRCLLTRHRHSDLGTEPSHRRPSTLRCRLLGNFAQSIEERRKCGRPVSSNAIVARPSSPQGQKSHLSNDVRVRSARSNGRLPPPIDLAARQLPNSSAAPLRQVFPCTCA
jgi:hypothetical protein